jgi:hypothetical protein
MGVSSSGTTTTRSSTGEFSAECYHFSVWFEADILGDYIFSNGICDALSSWQPSRWLRSLFDVQHDSELRTSSSSIAMTAMTTNMRGCNSDAKPVSSSVSYLESDANHDDVAQHEEHEETDYGLLQHRDRDYSAHYVTNLRLVEGLLLVAVMAFIVAHAAVRHDTISR